MVSFAMPRSSSDSGCRASEYAAGTELKFELGVLGIFGVFGIQVIKISEELIEAMNGGQELVAVAKMVLAELPGRVAERLEQFGERRIFIRQPFFGSRQSNLQHELNDNAEPERNEAKGSGSGRRLACFLVEEI
jgi:hypothetical protein